MPGYRLYFLDGQGSIQARQDFHAESDGEALTVSHLLWEACADYYAAFELWNIARRAAVPRDGGGRMQPPLEELPRALLQRVLDLHEALRTSRWSAARSSRLAAASDRVRRALDGDWPPITAEEIVRYIRAATGTPMMSFQRVENERLKLRGSHGFEKWFDEYFDIVGDDCCCGVAFKRAQQIIVPEIESSPIFAGQESLGVLRAARVAACVSTPLRAADGTVHGMFSIHRDAIWNPTGGELDQIETLAREISAAMASPSSAAADAMRRRTRTP